MMLCLDNGIIIFKRVLRIDQRMPGVGFQLDKEVHNASYRMSFCSLTHWSLFSDFKCVITKNKMIGGRLNQIKFTVFFQREHPLLVGIQSRDKPSLVNSIGYNSKINTSHIHPGN